MSAQPLVFAPVTASQYAQLVQKAQASGIDLTGNSGTASKFGVEIAYAYDPAAATLTLHCIKSPFFVSVADVHSRLEALVREALAG